MEKIYFLFDYVQACSCVGVYMCVSVGAQGEVRRGYLNPGARVAGVCNLPDMDAGDSIWVLGS